MGWVLACAQVNELKRLNLALGIAQAELRKVQEQLDEARRHSAFLDAITPPEWFADQIARSQADWQVCIAPLSLHVITQATGVIRLPLRGAGCVFWARPAWLPLPIPSPERFANQIASLPRADWQVWMLLQLLHVTCIVFRQSDGCAEKLPHC